MTATVDVSRGSNTTDPMVSKVWMSLSEEGRQINVTVRSSAYTDPTTLPPYGKVRIDYVGRVGGALQFNGFVDANGAAVTNVETGQNSSNVALALNAVDANTGSGIVQAVDQSNGTPQTVTYKIAYNSSGYARNAGSGDTCFDRTKANAKRSVWRYGVYDATTGARVDQAHPGFPIEGVVAANSGLTGVRTGDTMFGFAGYWGINFGGFDQSAFAAMPDGRLNAFSSITDKRPNNTTTYDLFKNSGKLTSWSRQTTTLGAMNGVPFNTWGDGCQFVNGATGANAASPGGASCAPVSNGGPMSQDFGNWVLRWNSALQVTRGATTTTGNFEIVGMQLCSPGSACVITTFSNPTPVQVGFAHMPVFGWSDAFGGNLSIPMPAANTPVSGTGTHADADPVHFYTQSTVVPSAAAALTLHCLNNCPTAASLAAYATGGSPYANSTGQQYGSGSSQVNYTFGSTGLLDGTATPVVLTTAPSGGSGQGDVMSGRLYTFDLAYDATTNACSANGSTSAAYCEPQVPDHYYTYQTGPNQWDQTTWLTKVSDGSTVAFDAPQNIPFAVPNDAMLYGEWAGKPIQLQFNGFGNLYGIPGHCVDPQTNQQASCSPSARYVPAFALADGTSLTMGSRSLLTLALDAELRLAPVSCTTAGLSTASVTATLPTTLPKDPSSPSDPAYIGTAPVLSSAPAVIDGVLQ
jgi:hypothetical protein